MLPDDELQEIQELARAQATTVAEWVRGALRAARRSEPLGDTGKMLEVVRSAARHSYPTADIDSMLDEIERSYLGESRR